MCCGLLRADCARSLPFTENLEASPTLEVCGVMKMPMGVPLALQKDLRVIASTSRDLQAETQSGGFRADLWYRLSMVQIHLPALRERADDVLLLARHFLTQFSARYGKAVQRMLRGAEAALLAYPSCSVDSHGMKARDRSCTRLPALRRPGQRRPCSLCCMRAWA